ncbi:ATP-binding protein [Streptomyces cinereoruber]|uniref:ATP-binding protein n=1 Tax=Streptomyces cinereoruber TaxID=67260 RepID=UPI003C2EEF8E
MILQLAPTWCAACVRRGAGRSRLALARRPQVARLARRHAAAVLRKWGLPPEVVDDIALVVSELVANADQHTEAGPRDLRLSMRGERVYVAVRDACPSPPVPATSLGSCVDVERGRGLAIVHALAEVAGCHHFEAGKVMWARMGVARPDGVGPKCGGQLPGEAPPFDLCSPGWVQPTSMVCGPEDRIRSGVASRLAPGV